MKLMQPSRSLASLLCGLSCLSAVLGTAPPAAADVNQLQKDFQTPPDDARIMVRWWWFGPAVTKAGIDRELNAMKAGGIGGVEVQPTYPLVVDGGTGDNAAKNIKWMSPEFLDLLGYTAAKCKELGMRMDLTMGSGWPYGGPMFSASEGAARIETQTVQVAAGQTSVPLPAGGRGGAGATPVMAAFAGPAGAGGGGGGRGGGRGGAGGGDVSALKELTIQNGAAILPAGFAGGEVIFFICGRTGMKVKRPAYGADGNVIDHLSATVVDKFIKQVAEPEIKACGANPPYAIFCDSLEVNGENWTDDFLNEFQKRRGYDLKPYLPALIGSIGARTEDIRHDFAQTATDLFDDNFCTKMKKIANQYNTRFRLEGYGSPPAGLLSYGFVDLPEGEGGGNGAWRTFRTTRYASSASHLMSLKVTSAETFTWLHAAPFRAIPLDIKGEVDTHFLDGINQTICHGWPFTPNGLAYPGASFYAAAVFDDKNPWYVAMPEVSGYIQRVSQMMREGTSANDVALYLNDSDLWAGAGPGYSSMNSTYTSQAPTLDALLNLGYDLDAWDDGMLAQRGKADAGTLAFGDVKYHLVVLNGAQRMPLATARQLEAFAKGGGILVAVGAAPARVPGFKATAADQAELAAIMQRLFTAAGAPGILLPNMAAFAQRVSPRLAPDFVTAQAANPTAIGTVHRHADGGEIYFIANTANQAQSFQATFRQTDTPELWDPLSAKVRPLAVAGKTANSTTVALNLPAYGSTLVVFTKRQLPAPAPTAAANIDLSAGWSVKFATGPGGAGKAVDMNALVDWITLPGMANYSGVATYEKKVTVPAAAAQAPMVLSFGPSGGGAAAGGRGGQGFAASLNSPVHDAAVVYVNDKRAGAAWCPPYQVDVTGLLKEGENTIRIDVGNTAVNYLAKAGFPNYNQRAVDAEFPPGNRFQPQGTQNYAQPLPSGIFGPIKLEPAPR